MKKRWIVFCAAALFAAGCASALDEAKAAPKTAVEKIRQLRETVDFNHAVRSHSMIDFSRGAFAGKIEKVLRKFKKSVEDRRKKEQIKSA